MRLGVIGTLDAKGRDYVSALLASGEYDEVVHTSQLADISLENLDVTETVFYSGSNADQRDIRMLSYLASGAAKLVFFSGGRPLVIAQELRDQDAPIEIIIQFKRVTR